MVSPENGSEQALESDKDVSCHPPSSTFFSKGLWAMLWIKHYGKVSLGNRTISNLQFAEGTDTLAKGEHEIKAIVDNLEKRTA